MHRSPTSAAVSVRIWLFVILAGAVALGPLPSAAGAAESSSTPNTDYQQVVDLTFPFEEGVPVRYGDDYDAPRGDGRHHQATDLMVALGTPVHAAMGGTVRWMSGDPVTGPPSYGWMVRIAGDDGRTYAYVHLGEQDGPWNEAYADGIQPGARVDRGQLLGWAGCSGSATCGGGEHLHFEIQDDNVVDPYDHHDHERINPVWSLMAAEQRGDHAFEGLFRDVPGDSTHAATIEKLALSGITKGCGASIFCPEQPVTRQQMASFLVRALDLSHTDVPHRFDDVPASNVHGADIGALAASGITRGCSSTSFCPGDPLTRAQMATFLVRALELQPAQDTTFSDVSTDNVHHRSISALAASGVTRGCATDRYCPDDVVTRAQMASFLVRALGL